MGIQKFESKRSKLESYIDKELKVKKSKEIEIKETIKSLEKKLSETKNDENDDVSAVEVDHPSEVSEPKKLNILDFIDSQIAEKEQELECPMCLEVAEAPILMCPEQHLICCSCRPKVKACPVCKGEYEEKTRRHGYAERTAEELAKIRKERVR